MTAQDDLIGVDLGGRFRVERFVANAMLGRVYAARGLEDGRLYHVKVPHASVSQNSEKAERFRRELQATGLVDSPHSVKVVDTGLHGDIAFLVTEYVAATPLQALLDAGPVPVERVVGVLAQVAWAIEAAHAVGVVHRNLSPQTILLLENAARGDYVKVSDFGLSRFTDDQATEAMVVTQAGTRIGNVLYMAPEYIEHDEVHPKGDLYALGALAYHLLVGRPPYTGKAADVLQRHVTEDPPRPSQARPSLPRWTDDLVAGLMQREPKDRPDPEQVVEMLERGVSHPLRAPPLYGVDAEGAVRRPDRTPYVVAGLGFGLFGVGLLVFLTSAVLVGGLWLAWTLRPLVVAQNPDLLPSADATLPTPARAEPEPDPLAPPAPVPSPNRRADPTLPAERAPAPVTPAPTPPPLPAAPVRTMVKIRSSQRAVVWVDERIAGYTPIDQEVVPGAHRVVGMVPGKPETRQERDVLVGATEPSTVEFTF